MLDRLETLERELADVEARLADPEATSNQERFVEISRRYSELNTIVGVGRQLRNRMSDADEAKQLMNELAGAERDEWRGELASAEEDVERLTEEFRLLLLPPDPNAGRNVIIEIRGAEGGEEANLFARDLFEMYRTYSQNKSWKLEILGSQTSDLGGLADITFRMSGQDVWTHMKFEAGPHRVQRVPVTESQGRVHTSSAAVTVLPEADAVEVNIDPTELQIDTFRASGAGGQHVNKTESAVRITHLPSGLVVSMQDEKSQLQNRERAMAVLRSRLLAQERRKAQDDASATRRDQVGGGGRSEKIRTYNFKENRVTDHRIGLTVHKLDKVLAGELTEISDALVLDERAQQLASDD